MSLSDGMIGSVVQLLGVWVFSWDGTGIGSMDEE